MSFQDAIIVLPLFSLCLGFFLAAVFPQHFGLNLK